MRFQYLSQIITAFFILLYLPRLKAESPRPMIIGENFSRYDPLPGNIAYAIDPHAVILSQKEQKQFWQENFDNDHYLSLTAKDMKTYMVKYWDLYNRKINATPLEEFLDDSNEKFSRSVTSTINLGVSATSVVYHIRLKNVGEPKRIYLKYDISKYSKLFLMQNGEIIRTVVDGNMFPSLRFDRYESGYVRAIPIQIVNDLDVYVQASSKMSFQVLDEENFLKEKSSNIMFMAGYFGAMLALIIYNFAIFLVSRSIAYLAYVFFLSSISIFIANENVLTTLVSDGLGIYATQIQSLGATVMCFSYIIFLRYFTRLWEHRICDFIFKVDIALMIPIYFFPDLRNYILLLLVVMLVIIVTIQIIEKKREAVLFALAALPLVIGATTTILMTLGYLPLHYLTVHAIDIGLVTEGILYSVAMGDKLRSLNSSLKAYVGQVEKLVAEKTRQISTILAHIGQGIFSILPNLTIDDHYSKRLENITGHRDLAGKNPIDLMFRDSNLSEDDIDRIRFTLVSSLGEDAINFSTNSPHLPGEIILHDKVIALDWQSIVNADDIVEKILVVARDVTELRSLENQTKIHRNEMIRIAEILEISQDACLQFFNQCQSFIKANHELIAKHKESDELSLNEIFINYHTMKGLARSASFKDLVDAIHQAEAYCAALQKKEEKWNQAILWDYNKCVSNILDEYIKLNNEKLGRKQGVNEIFSLETITSSLNLFKELPQELREKYVNLEKTIYYAYYSDTKTLFGKIFLRADALAKELGKHPPKVEIIACPVLFTKQAAILLENVFVHLIRNAIDHGLEKADIRKKLGKPIMGQLRLQLIMEEERLLIQFNDDGCGLNLKKLKAMGVTKNLISDQEQEPEKIAELIFSPGFSTVSTVTEISGRGVGLDAVRSYVEKNGGTVSIEFLENVSTVKEAVPFRYSLTLPASMFILDPCSKKSLPKSA